MLRGSGCRNCISFHSVPYRSFSLKASGFAGRVGVLYSCPRGARSVGSLAHETSRSAALRWILSPRPHLGCSDPSSAGIRCSLSAEGRRAWLGWCCGLGCYCKLFYPLIIIIIISHYTWDHIKGCWSSGERALLSKLLKPAC